MRKQVSCFGPSGARQAREGLLSARARRSADAEGSLRSLLTSAPCSLSHRRLSLGRGPGYLSSPLPCLWGVTQASLSLLERQTLRPQPPQTAAVCTLTSETH